MADSNTNSTEIVPIKDYADLRLRVSVPDSKTKTLKWLTAQIHERKSRIEAYKGQMANLEGALEVCEDELAELQDRLRKLEKL